MTEIIQSVHEVAATLQIAKAYNLEAEVVTWAMTELKMNPKLEITEALNLSLQEWLK